VGHANSLGGSLARVLGAEGREFYQFSGILAIVKRRRRTGGRCDGAMRKCDARALEAAASLSGGRNRANSGVGRV
jgi:hypothetical protein